MSMVRTLQLMEGQYLAGQSCDCTAQMFIECRAFSYVNFTDECDKVVSSLVCKFFHDSLKTEPEDRCRADHLVTVDF